MKFPKFILYLLAVPLVFLPAFVIYHSSPPGKELETLREANGVPTFLSFIGVVILLVIHSKFNYRHSKTKWDSGVFDGRQAFNEDTLLQAYIRLGGLMLRKDTDDLKGKITYLHRYFERHFENAYVDITEALNGSFHHPVHLSTITPWLKKNLRSNSQRSQLLYFLVGLSAVDGSINPREKQYLLQVADQLDVTRKDFDSIMAMYTKYEDAFNREQEQHSRRRAASSKPRGQYKREKAAKVLGVSVNASVDEIKKAYRSLAKVHHPDRFAGESESQQKIAEERFIKIQLAYELLLEFKN
ncbi:MAG: DnaJ domain-containing protein [Crocinitomicaceae bacterium]|nr:DnaJ domain-containing protein [Crocinitomicaceae bacterium]